MPSSLFFQNVLEYILLISLGFSKHHLFIFEVEIGANVRNFCQGISGKCQNFKRPTLSDHHD